MKSLWPVVFLIVAVGTGLRLFHLSRGGLRIDEGEVWARAQFPLVEILKGETYAPHTDVLAHFSSHWTGEAALRLPFAVYGSASLLWVFLLGRKLFDDEIALFACGLAALSPYLIQYAQEARYYSVFLFYSLAAFYFILAAIERDERSRFSRKALDWSGFILANSLNLYTHRFALYPLFLCGMFLLLRAAQFRLQGERERSRGLLWGGCGALACIFLLCLPQWHSLFDFLRNELQGTETMHRSYVAWHFMPREGLLGRMIGEFSGGWPQAVAFLGFATLGICSRWRDRAQSLVLTSLWVGLPLLSLFIVRTRTHFEFRYFIFLVPVGLMWVAAGISRAVASLMARTDLLRRAAWISLAAAGVLLINLPSLASLYVPRARMKEAVRHINESCAPGDGVVFYPQWDFYWYDFYHLSSKCRILSLNLLMAQRPDFEPMDMFREHDRIWLATTWIADPIRAEEFGHTRELIEKYYSLETKSEFDSPNQNDDFQVFSYRRKKGMTAQAPPRSALRRTPRDPGAAEQTDLQRPLRPGEEDATAWTPWGRQVFTFGRYLHMNIPEVLGAAPGNARGRLHRLPYPFESVLLRVDRAAGIEQPRYGFDHVLYAWSGAGELRSRSGVLRFHKGDVLMESGREPYRLSASAPEGAVLYLIPVSTTTIMEGAGQHLFNAWDDTALPAVGGVKTVSRTEGRTTVSVRRLGPGAVDPGTSDAPYRAGLGVSIVLQGQVAVQYRHWRRTDSLDFRQGDVHSVWGWRNWNPGPDESLQFQVVREARQIPAHQPQPVSPATGKRVVTFKRPPSSS